MGLLDAFQQPQQAQGGLLGAMMPQGGQGAPQGGGQSRELQMAQQLAQNPTPQMVQQIVQQMRQAGMQGADEIAEHLMQAGDDQQLIKQFADAAVQALSAQ